MKMNKKEIEKLAFNSQELDENSDAFDEVYWLGVYYISQLFKAKLTGKEQATYAKQTLYEKILHLQKKSEPDENVIDCFNAGVQEQIEISKLILPAEKVDTLSRDDLLELIARIRAILQGVIDKCDEELPNFARDGLLTLIKEENELA